MKVTIWIRERDGVPTVRTDTKYENGDTPFIQRVGRKILDALEGEGK